MNKTASEHPNIHAQQAVTEETALVQVNMTVNGRARAMTVEVRTTLLDALRDELGLTGTKKACDRGECACTVHAEGRRVLSCMRDVEGLSMAEVADALGITVTTAKTRAHRARLLLRKRLSMFMASAGASVEGVAREEYARGWVTLRSTPS